MQYLATAAAADMKRKKKKKKDRLHVHFLRTPMAQSGLFIYLCTIDERRPNARHAYFNI